MSEKRSRARKTGDSGVASGDPAPYVFSVGIAVIARRFA